MGKVGQSWAKLGKVDMFSKEVIKKQSWQSWCIFLSIYKKNYISTLPTLPIIKRSKISPKISPTLLRVWIISIYKKNYFSTLPSLPWIKDSYLNFANFALHMMFNNKKKYVPTLPTLLLYYHFWKHVNFAQLCPTLPNYAF